VSHPWGSLHRVSISVRGGGIHPDLFGTPPQCPLADG
jgi:hypothetical protein